MDVASSEDLDRATDDIDELGGKIQTISQIILNLLEGKSRKCSANHDADLSCIKTTNKYGFSCFCKNKVIHNKKCFWTLRRQMDKRCDCDIRKIREILDVCR